MNGILGWKALTQYGVLLCLFGFFGPEFDLWGKPVYVWALRAGFLLFVGGLVMGAVLAATGRLTKGSADHHAQGGGRRHRFTHDSIGAGSAVAAAGAAAIAGPMVNVDGTPMMDGGMFDVMGKAYGDSGTSFSHDFGGGIGISMDSSSIGGSNW